MLVGARHTLHLLFGPGQLQSIQFGNFYITSHLFMISVEAMRCFMLFQYEWHCIIVNLMIFCLLSTCSYLCPIPKRHNSNSLSFMRQTLFLCNKTLYQSTIPLR